MNDSGVLASGQMTGPAPALGNRNAPGLETFHLNPGSNSRSGLIRDLELHRPFGLLLHHNRSRGDAVPMAGVRNTKLHQTQARSLLSMSRLNSARSLARAANCSRIRTAQTSFNLSGVFWPTILPLFQGMRREHGFGSMTRSWQLKGGVSWSLTGPERTSTPTRSGQASEAQRIARDQIVRCTGLDQ
jgi:hypothetical protein